MPNTKSYMSIGQAADYLSVSYFTVYKHVQSGRIPAERYRSTYKLLKSDVEAFKQERDEAAKFDRRRAIRS